MRIFSLLAAIAVSGLLYMLIVERPTLMAALGIDQDAPGAEELVEEAQSEAAAAKALVKVIVQKSEEREIDTGVALRGQTEAARTVSVRAETSASVISEPLRKGAYVTAGQTLCELEPGNRGSALAQARAQLDAAQAHVPEAEARVAQARAQLEEAQINQNASAQLNKEGFASTTRLASTEAAVATAQAAVEAARAGVQTAKSNVETARANVDAAEREVERLTIKAPFGGLLESDTAELGTLLRPGDLCATIVQLDPIKLVSFVPETEVSKISVGALAGARLAAGGAEVRGNVSFLSRSADDTTRTFRVEIEVSNSDNAIRDGQTAEILIRGNGIKAHLLPQSALTLNDEGVLGVRTINASNIVGFSPVTLLRDEVNGVWVTGLPSPAQVIVEGQEYVIAGVKVDPSFRELSQ